MKDPVAALCLLVHVAEGEVFLPGELETGKLLDEKYEKFTADFQSCDNRAAGKHIRQLKEQYELNPSEENKNALTTANLDRESLDEKFRQIRGTMRRVMAEFLQAKYRPFFAVILQRLMERAREEIEVLRTRQTEIAERYGIAVSDDGLILAIIEARSSVGGLCYQDNSPLNRRWDLPAHFPRLIDALLYAQESYRTTQKRLAERDELEEAALQREVEAEKSQQKISAVE